MYLNGLTAFTRLNSAVTPPSRDADIEAPPTEAADALQQMNALLRTMIDDAEQAAEATKARAKERLDRAKGELEWLQRWGFSAEFVAKQAARLAKEVGAIAREFAGALSGGDAMSAPHEPATPVGNTVAATETAEPTEPEDARDGTVSTIPHAYREAMDTTREGKSQSASDRQFIEEIKAVANQIKRLLDEAIRKMKSQNDTPSDDVQSASGAKSTLTNAISALESAAGSILTMASITL